MLAEYELKWTCFVQDVDDAHCIRYPKLYLPGLKDALFNIRVFSWSVIEGIVSSLVLFFIPYGAFVHSIDQDGIDKADLQSFGTVVAATLVVAVNLRVSDEGRDVCTVMAELYLGLERGGILLPNLMSLVVCSMYNNCTVKSSYRLNCSISMHDLQNQLSSNLCMVSITDLL